MKTKLVQMVAFLGCAAMLHSMTALAEDNDTEISLSAGVEFTSGTYGGDEDIKDTYIPLTTTIDNGRFTFRLTVAKPTAQYRQISSSSQISSH